MSFHTVPIQNALTNSLDFLDKFRDKVGNAYMAIQDEVERKPWGGYGLKRQTESSSSGERFPTHTPIETFMKKSKAEQAARIVGGLATDDAAKTARRVTNIPQQIQQEANNLPAKVGIRSDSVSGDPLAAAILAKGAPYLSAYMVGTLGSPARGFRPRGEKAVYPKSKEEDPTGREVGNPLAEAIGRTVFFQRGQLLPYGEFRKERPDVMPSTYRDYMAYQYSKPEAGSLVTIDPQRGSFTAFAGAVKGSAKGLNDPEIRVRGLRATASQVAGMAAGRYAMGKTGEFLSARHKGTRYDTNPENTFVPNVSVDNSMIDVMRTGEKVKDFAARKADTPAGRQKIEDAIRASRAKQLTAYAKDIEDDYAYMNRGLKGGTKITTDRLQSLHTGKGRDEVIGKPLMTRSSKEIKGGKVVDSGPKPYNEFRVGIRKEADPSKRALIQQALDQSKQESQKRVKQIAAESKIKTKGEKVENFLRDITGSYTGEQYRPYVQMAVGAAAALGTAYAVKKGVQKINEKRAKKQDPVEYLKYKHGSFANAKKALKQPNAKSYQDLIPYVK